MAYEKTTWAAGDIVTAAKLNNLENGVANASTIILNGILENDILKLNMTAGDLYMAIKSGHTIMLCNDESNNQEFLHTIRSAGYFDKGYYFEFNGLTNKSLVFTASSADDYPEPYVESGDDDN